LIALISLIVLIPIAASADPMTKSGWRGWGPRVGVTMNPDQIHFGAHLDFGNFAKHIRFQPNLEVGIGDNLTIFAVNFDAAYRFQSRWDVWTPYVGGGIGVNFVNFDHDFGHHDDHSQEALALGAADHLNDSDTQMGFNVLGGIEKGLSKGHRFFLEARLGLADSPDFKVTAGWTFFH
jgi:opacity protein-like surface antigen